MCEENTQKNTENLFRFRSVFSHTKETTTNSSIIFDDDQQEATKKKTLKEVEEKLHSKSSHCERTEIERGDENEKKCCRHQHNGKNLERKITQSRG